MEQHVQVDGVGLHFAPGYAGSGDVIFDGHHAWSFAATPREDERPVLVPWPTRMTPWLHGTSDVVVREGETDLFHGEVVFGSGEGRVRFLDKSGIPVMIDKWGLLQRPFSGRDAGVVEQLVDVTEEMLEIMRTECGIEGWMAFGTLLGAAREGAVIGHDSDVDLAYLSEQTTPAAMTAELYGVARALRRHGLRVLGKSGAFITVVFTSPDGALSSIDLYTCFHLQGQLYETATVRRPVPRSAIVPLTELEFEGRMLPAPADPDAMLAVSYGPDWRIPDPAFRHAPGPEITERFDGWFSSVMRQRRDWERFLAERSVEITPAPSDFVAWVGERLAPGTLVLDVGTGNGQDALTFAAHGWPVLGLDYARQSTRRAARLARRNDLPVKFDTLNLYDLRDVLSRAALVARETSARKAVYARELLETLDPDGLEGFWRLMSMVMRGGGELYVESLALGHHDAVELRRARGGGRVHPLDPRAVQDAVLAAGGRVVARENVVAGTAAPAGGAPARWRLHARWPNPAGLPDPTEPSDGDDAPGPGGPADPAHPVVPEERPE